MRKLFVPACLCVITLSGSIGDERKMSSEHYSAHRQEPTAAVPVSVEATEAAPPASGIADARDEATVVIVPIETPIAIPMQAAGAPALIQAVPLPKPKPEIKPVIYRSTEEVCDALTKAAQDHGLPAAFFIRLLFQESRFSPAVVSNAGAQGIAQFMPDTASDVGLDNPFDPLEAIPASARHLRNLFERFGNLGLAAAAYNAGPRRIEDWLAKKGPLPQETQGYVKTVTGRPAEEWTARESGAPAVKLPRHAPCQDAAGLLAWNGPEEVPVPAVAPHRRPKEPIAVATAAVKVKPGDGAKTEAKNEAKNEAKIARPGGRAAALVKVADASRGLARAGTPAAKAKPAEARKDPAKKESGKKRLAKADPVKTDAAKNKDAKKNGKGALQLAARKQNKRLRLSQR